MRPSLREQRWAHRALEPWRMLLDPAYFHMDRVPKPGGAPLIFVGNHTLYGLLDIPHLYLRLLAKHDIYLRSMGDRAHFRLPGWAEFMARWGVVEGTRERCSELLAQGESVLVFPGGAREVAKRRGEKYTLVWKERLGFVKLAITHGATIVPFAMLGGDDAWDILWDKRSMQSGPFGPLINAVYDQFQVPRDSMMPLAAGLGMTPMPKPVRLYFSIAEPISALPFAGQEQDEQACYRLRGQVEAAIYGELDFLATERKWDPASGMDKGGLRQRLLRRLLK